MGGKGLPWVGSWLMGCLFDSLENFQLKSVDMIPSCLWRAGIGFSGAVDRRVDLWRAVGRLQNDPLDLMDPHIRVG